MLAMLAQDAEAVFIENRDLYTIFIEKRECGKVRDTVDGVSALFVVEVGMGGLEGFDVKGGECLGTRSDRWDNQYDDASEIKKGNLLYLGGKSE